jgi:SAM-dependent methyltransferase
MTNTSAPSVDSARQQRHYEEIHDAYEAHYYDPPSLRYRERFILGPLLDGVDLNDRDVLDLASGSGHNTLLLRRMFPRMRAVGIDISDSACRAYEETTGFPAVQGDFTQPVSFGRQFDAVVVIGGLHHLVIDLPQAIANLASAVRDDGVVLMMEPSADSLLEGLRRMWYRRDAYFDAPTERALSHDAIVTLAGGAFTPDVVRYIGGPAYFAVFNSLVLRVPLRAKPILALATFPVEAAVNSLNLRSVAPVFIARWRRRPRP